jgi:hypothetical protein
MRSGALSRPGAHGAVEVGQTAGVRTFSRVVAALLLAVLATVAPLTGSSGGTAWAEAPFRLPDQVTDHAGALSGDQSRVQSALSELRKDTGVQLFVVFVDSFDGVPAQQWTQQTFQQSDLGADDYLLAVAVHDRSYAYWVANSAQISDSDLATVARDDIEPHLASNDWAGAVVAAADGYRAALTGSSADGGSSSGSGRSVAPYLLLWVLVGGGVIALAAFYLRRKKPGARPSAPQPSVADLSAQANRLLVSTDDAVRSSEQELGFAVAEFGTEETATFSQALQEAHKALARGFAIKQQLEDDIPETEPQQRQLLTEVIDVCTRANDLLDAQADRFNQLRDLLSSAPQRLSKVLSDADALEARLPDGEQQIAQLRQRYAPTALVTVDRNVTEAQGRLEFARETARRGQQALDSTDQRAEAAVAVQAAEASLGQARQLLDAVARAGSDLADAVTRLPEAIRDARSDLAAAHADGTPPEAIATAQAAIDAAEKAQASDPLGALHRVVEADAALDRARTTAREERDAREKATRALEQALLAARSEIQSVEDFIATRRGAVGGQARTRLAEARRHLDAAEQLRDSDPVQALEEARRADQLAEDAGRLARSDVDGWYNQGPGPGGVAGPMGGRGDNSGLLAGIILGQILGGGGRGGWGGGGGFGGGFGGAGRGGGGGFGGGFGGGRGGGGRF